MTHRGFTSFVAVFISAAICLQPRVAFAVADMDDLATWLSQINGQLIMLNDEFADYADIFKGEQYQSAWFRGTMQRREAFQDSVETTLRRAMFEMNWTPRAAGRTNGMVRGLWNVDASLHFVSNALAPYSLDSNRGGNYYVPNNSWGFLYYGGEDNRTTDSHVEFETITQGQTFDAELFMYDPLWLGYPSQEMVDWAFTNAFNPFGYFGKGLGAVGLSIWTLWQAEAWRRQLDFFNSVPVSNLVGWIDSEIPATNELNSFLVDSVSTNSDDAAAYNGSLERYGAVELVTNSVSWFGPSGSSGDRPELVADIDWSIEGQANEVRIFGFDALDPSYSGTLVVDFSQEPFSTMHTVCSWLVTVTTAVAIFMILRHEVNYWTTLGGSAT